MKYLLLVTVLMHIGLAQAEEDEWWIDSAEYYQEWDAHEQAVCDQVITKDEFGALVAWRIEIYQANYELLAIILADLIELESQINLVTQTSAVEKTHTVAERFVELVLPPMITRLSDELSRLGQDQPGLEIMPEPEQARTRCHEIFHEAKFEIQSTQSLIRIELEQIEPIMLEYHNSVFQAKLRAEFESTKAPASP